jgi:hypothetical protein
MNTKTRTQTPSSTLLADRRHGVAERFDGDFLPRQHRCADLPTSRLIRRVRFADHVVLAAIGIDSGGRNRLLGLREGATENVASCKARFADLIERGLATEQSVRFCS